MATTRSADSKTQDSGAASAQEPLLTSPLILERRKSKKKKKKYSRGTKGQQRFLFGLSKAGYRVANSFSEGLNTFVKRSNKSGRKRRDGMVRYALRNAGRGLGDGLSELSKAPDDLTRRIGTRPVWRTFRIIASPFGG